MARVTRPLLALYVIWHPSHPGGRIVADRLREHFVRGNQRAIGEMRGVGVLERSTPVPGERTPLPVSWDDAEFTAVVVLTESKLVEDSAWVEYVRDIAKAAIERGNPAGFLPVSMDGNGWSWA